MGLPTDKLRGQHPDTLRVLRYAERWGVRVVPAHAGRRRGGGLGVTNRFFGCCGCAAEIQGGEDIEILGWQGGGDHESRRLLQHNILL